MELGLRATGEKPTVISVKRDHVLSLDCSYTFCITTCEYVYIIYVYPSDLSRSAA